MDWRGPLLDNTSGVAARRQNGAGTLARFRDPAATRAEAMGGARRSIPRNARFTHASHRGRRLAPSLPRNYPFDARRSVRNQIRAVLAIMFACRYNTRR